MSSESLNALLAHILLCPSFSMGRFLKSFAASLISSVLLYYSAAWTVLRCSHDDEDVNSGFALFDGGAAGLSSTSAAEAHLDCLDSDYHTETLAGPSSSVKFDQLTGRDAFQLAAPSALHGPATVELRGAWLTAVFRTSVTVTSPIRRRYLSLSILRI